MVEASVSELTERERARIIKAGVTPRPIAWISTVSGDGTDNLAPFSSYNYVGSRKPVVLFNTRSEGSSELKDTPRNILETNEFAVNVVTERHLEKMDHTGKSIPSDESEFDVCGVNRERCERISSPRVADAAMTMECTFLDSLEVYDRLMILGEVEYIHIDDSVLTEGKIDSRKIATVGRLGGPFYTISDPIEFERKY